MVSKVYEMNCHLQRGWVKKLKYWDFDVMSVSLLNSTWMKLSLRTSKTELFCIFWWEKNHRIDEQRIHGRKELAWLRNLPKSSDTVLNSKLGEQKRWNVKPGKYFASIMYTKANKTDQIGSVHSKKGQRTRISRLCAKGTHASVSWRYCRNRGHRVPSRAGELKNSRQMNEQRNKANKLQRNRRAQEVYRLNRKCMQDTEERGWHQIWGDPGLNREPPPGVLSKGHF